MKTILCLLFGLIFLPCSVIALDIAPVHTAQAPLNTMTTLSPIPAIDDIPLFSGHSGCLTDDECFICDVNVYCEGVSCDTVTADVAALDCTTHDCVSGDLISCEFFKNCVSCDIVTCDVVIACTTSDCVTDDFVCYELTFSITYQCGVSGDLATCTGDVVFCCPEDVDCAEICLSWFCCPDQFDLHFKVCLPECSSCTDYVIDPALAYGHYKKPIGKITVLDDCLPYTGYLVLERQIAGSWIFVDWKYFVTGPVNLTDLYGFNTMTPGIGKYRVAVFDQNFVLQGYSDPFKSRPAADINQDGKVNKIDWILYSQAPFDITCDGIINSADKKAFHSWLGR